MAKITYIVALALLTLKSHSSHIPHACKWTEDVTVVVDPPPVECCTTGWESDTVCNPIQNALNGLSDADKVKIVLREGTYCNKNLYKNLPSEDPITKKLVKKTPEEKSKNNGGLIKIDSKQYIRLTGEGESKKPLLKIDGWYGIDIRNSDYITIDNIEIEGPNM